jgi:hypothetical protein
MHKAMTNRILRATLLFFDSTPIGRIVTRFSKDVGIFDAVVPGMFSYITMNVFRITVVIITIAIVN